MPSLGSWSVCWNGCPTEVLPFSSFSGIFFQEPSLWAMTEAHSLRSAFALSFFAYDDFDLDDAAFVHLHNLEREVLVGQPFMQLR